MSLDAFEDLFFDSARKASNDVSTFLNLRFIKKQKSAVFLRKCYMLTNDETHQQLSPKPINRTIFSDNSNQKRKPRKKGKT